MKSVVYLIASAALSLSVAGCAASDNPQQLAKSLQTALDSGDLDAASKLADLSGSPAMAHSMFLESVITCSGPSRCSVQLAPMDEEYRQRLQEQASRLGIEGPVAEGLLVVDSKSEDGSASGSFKMPYAKIDGAYRIASARHSDDQLASLRARTNDSLLQELFARGVPDPATGGARTDWATAASSLPADGGPAGRSLVSKAAAMHEAVLAKDPDAALRAGDRFAEMLLGTADYDGNPVSMQARQRQLHVMSLTNLHDIKVIEGYTLDDLAVLVIEARDGIGWVVRGAVLMMQDGENWGVAGHNYVKYPADS